MIEHNIWRKNIKALKASGITQNQIIKILDKIKEECPNTQSEDIGKKISCHIAHYASNLKVDNYKFWINLFQNRKTIAIFVMGVTGVGKTEIIGELAESLDNLICVSGDLFREILRNYLPEYKYPLLWTSSYDAWERINHKDKTKDLIIEAFLKQNKILFPAIKSLVDWSKKVGKIVVFESVNIDCNTLKNILRQSKVQIFPFLITAKEQSVHWSLLEFRHNIHPCPPVPLKKYKKYFSNIRHIQEFMIVEATKFGIPILEHGDVNKLANEILESVARNMFSKSTPEFVKKLKGVNL